MLVAGVDGCRGGWLCLVLDTANGNMEIRYPTKFAELFEQKPKPKIIAIDIPIGLWEKGDRPCDKEARKFLGWPRRCSVFPPPPRSALNGKNDLEAKELSKRACGKSLSKQTLAIRGKISEVDQAMTARVQKWVQEVHPEVSFCALNQGHALKYSKKTKEGVEERLDLLRPWLPGLNRLLGTIDRRNADVDDLLDRAAAAWTARRIASKQESRLTSEERDRKRLRMEIVY